MGGFPRGIATLGENQFFIDAWLLINLHQEFAFGWNKSVFGILNFEGVFPSWLVGFEVRPWPVDATRQYANIRHALERAGQPIGGMDLMIAAHALAEDAVLVTNNAREFLRVPGLAVEEWALPL